MRHFPGPLLCACCALLGAALGGALGATGDAPATTALLAPEAAWLARAATEISRDGESDAGLDALLEAVGDSRVVLLGEPTHGDGAVFELKARIVERLWRERGFGLVAFESGLYDVDAVDRALVAGESLESALPKGIFGIWSGAAEVRPLFERIAAARRGERPLRLAGIDCQVTGTGSESGLARELGEALDAPGVARLSRSARKAIEDLLPKLVDVSATDPLRLERAEVARLVSALDDTAKALDGAGTAVSRTALLAQSARNLALFAEIEHGIDPTDAAAVAAAGARRDRQMAENLLWLLERAPGEKIVVWAASRHTLYRPEEILSARRAPQYPGGRSFGEELRQRLGEQVYSLGFAAGGGSWGKTWESPKPLAPPIPGSLEAHWLESGAESSFLDLRARRDGDGWLHRPLVARPLGYTEMIATWPRQFDGLVFVREMTPATRVAKPAAPSSEPPSSSGALSPPAVEIAAGALAIEPRTALRFRRVPGGVHRIGSPATEHGRRAHEDERTVRLSPYWLAETEVTQGLWRELVGSRPSHFAHCGDACPVESVDWYEAVTFANRLSERAGLEGCYELTGCAGLLGGGCPDRSARRCEEGYSCAAVELRAGCRGFRLPTEAEWEVAARAGVSSALPEGELELDDVNDAPGLDAWAWYAGNSGASYRGAFPCATWKGRQEASRWCGPQPVGTKRANAWGLFDLLGNVLELCEDRTAWSEELGRLVTSTDGAGETTDPVGATGEKRVLRGGSWYAFPRDTRFAHRGSMRPTTRNQTVGFRLALDAEALAPSGN